MACTEKIAREESLWNWRSAILLTFNGFLITALTAASRSEFFTFLDCAVPKLGLAISLSTFVVSLMSCNVIAEESSLLGRKEKFCFWCKQFFGPYILSSFLLLIFWLTYIFTPPEKKEIVCSLEIPAPLTAPAGIATPIVKCLK